MRLFEIIQSKHTSNVFLTLMQIIMCPFPLLSVCFIQSFLKYRDDDGTYVDNIQLQQQSPRTVAVTHDRHTAGVLVEHNTK